jgi:hypothetical protein
MPKKQGPATIDLRVVRASVAAARTDVSGAAVANNRATSSAAAPNKDEAASKVAAGGATTAAVAEAGATSVAAAVANDPAVRADTVTTIGARRATIVASSVITAIDIDPIVKNRRPNAVVMTSLCRRRGPRRTRRPSACRPWNLMIPISKRAK